MKIGTHCLGGRKHFELRGDSNALQIMDMGILYQLSSYIFEDKFMEKNFPAYIPVGIIRVLE